MVHFHRCAFRREFLMEKGIKYPAMRRGEDPVYMAEVLTKACSFTLMDNDVYFFNARPRYHQFPYEHIRDAIAARGYIRRIMRDAGYPELGFFFDCYYLPFSTSHARLTYEETLKVSEQLIDFAKLLPPEILEHSYLDYPACDKIALHHDILVAKNSTPEVVADLIRRGMFCGMLHLRDAELRDMRLLLFILRVYRAVKRRLPGRWRHDG